MNDFLISWPTYKTIMFVWMGLAVAIFFLLLKITAPYGRHASSGWGPQISNNTGWLMMEIPVLIVLGIFILPAINSITTASWAMIGLFCFHYFYRSLIFPFRLHTKGKKMPWVIVGSGILFNLVSGFSLGYYFTRFADYSNDWFMDIRFIAGIVLFFTGLYINWKADDMLIHLRKPDETHYVIPQGWLFNKISCPNLFGELIEWLGFAILCWNLPALTFFIWTAANLIPRALSHHKWYKEKFTAYPAGRKAILPFIV
jgi:3-oxo-5-alpha-steroid 4-dehydrogenase 1